MFLLRANGIAQHLAGISPSILKVSCHKIAPPYPGGDNIFSDVDCTCRFGNIGNIVVVVVADEVSTSGRRISSGCGT